MKILLSIILILSIMFEKSFEYDFDDLGFRLISEKEYKIMGPDNGTYIWISNSENKNIGGIFRRNRLFKYDDFKKEIITHNGAFNGEIISNTGVQSNHKVKQDDKVYYYFYKETEFYNFMLWGINEHELELLKKSFNLNNQILKRQFEEKIDYPFGSDSVITFLNSESVKRDLPNIFTINIDRNIYNEPYILIYDATLHQREENIFSIGEIRSDVKQITIKISSSDSTGQKILDVEKTYLVK